MPDGIAELTLERAVLANPLLAHGRPHLDRLACRRPFGPARCWTPAKVNRSRTGAPSSGTRLAVSGTAVPMEEHSRVQIPKGWFMKSELEKFYALIEQIEVAMLTTRRPDGHLESRAMANQKKAAGADLWFVTAEGTGKLRDLQRGPARQPLVLQGPHQGVDFGLGSRDDLARSGRRSASYMLPIGRRGFLIRAIPAMARPTTRASF